MQISNESVKENITRDWADVWQEFHRDKWFRERLDKSAHSVLRQTNLPRGWKDDVKQEALIVFANALKRDTTLGFDDSRGNIKPFISTVIYRCCQKGIRQFRNSMKSSRLHESVHPLYEITCRLDEHLDLNEMLLQIPEPYRNTAQQVLDGKSIEQIAEEYNLSSRTIYRYIDRATVLLREKMDIEQNV